MARVRWTPAAIQDVERLHTFLAAKDREVARRAVGVIREGVRALASHPRIGRLMEEMPPEFREWIIPFGSGNYIALYHHDGRDVVILAMRHNRESSGPDRIRPGGKKPQA